MLKTSQKKPKSTNDGAFLPYLCANKAWNATHNNSTFVNNAQRLRLFFSRVFFPKFFPHFLPKNIPHLLPKFLPHFFCQNFIAF